jgi:hydrogenase maturation protease
VIRSWEALEGSVDVHATRLRPGLARITVEIANRTPWGASAGNAREDVLRRTLCSTHTVLRATRGRFVSLADPPEELRAEAEACRNEGAWPVLVGEPGSRDTVLASPIILEDHPRIAPESPGDLFDGGEIDQLLILNILTLTDEEKAEMRDSDPRAREILERTEALGPEELMRLHGAIRDFQAVRR